MLVLISLLVANELPAFRRLGRTLHISLFSLCVMSYFNYIVPIGIGSVGLFEFILSILVSILFLTGWGYGLLRLGAKAWPLWKDLAFPAIAIHLFFFTFYALEWIPPVPVSIQFIGIYHDVKKEEGKYLVSHQKPWWKFWNVGDQDFYFQAGDQIFCFARIFSPADFKDTVQLHWLRKNKHGDWISWDRIPMVILGGRKEGFRGYAYKKNYEEGEWQVRVETKDQREIGRTYFSVIPDPTQKLRSKI